MYAVFAVYTHMAFPFVGTLYNHVSLHQGTAQSRGRVGCFRAFRQSLAVRKTVGLRWQKCTFAFVQSRSFKYQISEWKGTFPHVQIRANLSQKKSFAHLFCRMCEYASALIFHPATPPNLWETSFAYCCASLSQVPEQNWIMLGLGSETEKKIWQLATLFQFDQLRLSLRLFGTQSWVFERGSAILTVGMKPVLKNYFSICFPCVCLEAGQLVCQTCWFWSCGCGQCWQKNH